jgi:hypothetical protein
MIGYNFNPETGEFEGAYDVNTGKDLPGVFYASEPGRPESGYGVFPSKGDGQGAPGVSSGEGGISEGVGVGSITENEPGPVSVSVSGERKAAQQAARRRRRRSLISQEEPGGLLQPAILRRRSLLGV